MRVMKKTGANIVRIMGVAVIAALLVVVCTTVGCECDKREEEALSPNTAVDSEGEPKTMGSVSQGLEPGHASDVFNSKDVQVGTILLKENEPSEVYWADKDGTEIGRAAVETAGEFYYYGWLDPENIKSEGTEDVKRLVEGEAEELLEAQRSEILVPRDIGDNVASVKVEAAAVNNCTVVCDTDKPLYTTVDVTIAITYTLNSGEQVGYTSAGQFRVNPESSKIETMMISGGRT